MKKTNNGKIFFVCSTLLIIAICLAGCSKTINVKNLETKYLSPSYVVDMDKPEEVIGICNNVFVGYVESMKDTYYISDLPYTRYNVRVIKNIKGDLPLDTTVLVNKEGGVSEDLSYNILFENDSLPDEGKYYIFNVRERTEDGSYTASGMNTTILIDDIDMPSITGDITSKNSNKEIDLLEKSKIYKKYVDAFQKQKLYDPKK